MPELDPSWEYYEPDPEIAEVMGDGASSISNYDRIMDDRLYKNGLLGIRFGVGDPNRLVLRESREKLVNTKELTRRLCSQCGYSFQPKRATRVYCSRECKSKGQLRIGNDSSSKVHRTPHLKVCEVCSKEYSTIESRQRVCSHSCASKLRGNKLSGLDRFKSMYESGVKLTDIAVELDISPVTAKKWRRRLKLDPRGPRGVTVAS